MDAKEHVTAKRKLKFTGDPSESESEIFDSDDSIKDKDYVESYSSSEASDLENLSNADETALEDNVIPENDNIIERQKPVSPEKYKSGRWRRANPELCLVNKRRDRRNRGQAYKNKSGKDVLNRCLGPPCKCKKNCREKLVGKEAEIFNSFWDMADYDLQNSYLFSCIEARNPKRRYPKKTKSIKSRRNVTLSYIIKVNGQNLIVCKEEFLSVHGLQNSRKRVQLICEQITEGRTTPRKDGRGKHKNRANKVADIITQSIVDHINSIPKYTSHYSREKNPEKLYFDCDLNISTLYKDFYLNWCKEKELTPASEDKYRRVFCTDFNIGFKLPKTDTCKTCDSLAIKMKSNTQSTQERTETKIKLELHQNRALGMQNSLKQEVENAKNNKKDIISFDLQQALPTPNITVGPAFYLRKLWTYNLGIHDCINEKGFMYMWTENVSKRGCDEICSVILKYITDHPSSNEELIVYTDNCGGQNKNWTLMALWLHLVRNNTYKSIEHRFLISGHTHLPSDRDFALIEKAKKKFQQVYAPEQWYECVQKAKRANPFDVIEMKSEDFYSFSEISNNLQKKKHCEDKEPLKFSNVRCFKFDSNYPNIMFIKYLYNEEFRSVNVVKRGRPILHKLNELKNKYDGPLKINPKKISDVTKLLPYIPPCYHEFYTKLEKEDNDDEADEEESNVEQLQ